MSSLRFWIAERECNRRHYWWRKKITADSTTGDVSAVFLGHPSWRPAMILLLSTYFLTWYIIYSGIKNNNRLPMRWNIRTTNHVNRKYNSCTRVWYSSPVLWRPEKTRGIYEVQDNCQNWQHSNRLVWIQAIYYILWLCGQNRPMQYCSGKLDAGMLHALFPVNPITAFIGIFLLSVILYTLKVLVKYAQVFWSKRTQQTNLAISKDTPSTMSPTEGGESLHVILWPVGPVSPETATEKSKSSGGDSVSVLGINGTSNSSTSIHIKNDNPQAERPDYCGTQDQNCQTHLCKEIPEDCYGSSTRRGARYIPNFGRDNQHDRLYESSMSGLYQSRSESLAHQGTGEAAPCWTDKTDSTNIRCKQTNSRATQIYLKKREVGTHPPYVLDSEDSDKIILTLCSL